MWDDEVIRRQVLAFPGWRALLHPPPGIPNWTYLFYRPLTVASYAADMLAFGPDNATGAHLANVAYHLLATAGVWLLARHVLASRPAATAGATVAATLFAVHPVHVESVSWIAGRSDVLATALLLPALVLASRRDLASVAASAGLFLLALLAKEVAIAGLALVPLLWWASTQPDRTPARLFAPLGAWSAAAVVYFLMRSGASLASAIDPAADGAEVSMRLAQAVAWYARMLVLPWPQSNFVAPEMLPTVATGLVVLAVGAVAIAASLRYASRTGYRDLAAGLSWTCVCILPSLAVALPGVLETPVAERYLYLPSVGAAIAAGALYCELAGRVPARAVIAAVLALALAGVAATLYRGRVWLTDARLWTDTTTRVTGYAIPWIELGESRLEAGDEAGALESYERARGARMTPATRVLLGYKIGDVQWARGDREAALDAYRAAVDADPSIAISHQVLGLALLRRDVSREATPEEAIAELERAVALDPRLAESQLGLATAYLARGDALRDDQRTGEAQASYRAAEERLEAARRLDALAASSLEAGRLRSQLRSRLAHP